MTSPWTPRDRAREVTHGQSTRARADERQRGVPVTELYAVRMDVALPPGMDPAARDDLLAREKAYSQEWQRSGHWRHIWRCAGQYANLSIFAVEGNEQLHEILWGLPLFPYMAITITPLAGHPSDIAEHRTDLPPS